MASDQVTIDELLDVQQDVSQEILKLISNYKKDSAERKSQAGYHKIKAKTLNEKWSIIQGNDETIRKTGELPENHEYFTFFNDIKSTVLKYQEAINKDAESLSKKTAKLEDGQRQQPSLDPKNTKVEDGQRQQPTVEPKVTALCRRQKAMIASLYRTLQQPMEHTAVELIRNLWTQIQDVHFRLYEEVEIPEENGYDIKEYLKAERDVQGALAAKSPSECTNDRNLPRITIPKFDGDILKWTQFFDMFVSMVHETNMPTIRKMWYLKTSVVGEAERMIRQIDLKEDNYLHAWNILVDTYDNPRDIATTVLNRFLNQQAINDNVKSLKELYIVTMESLASLKGLGIDISTWDPILIEVLRNKLDSTNKTLYEQSISDSKHIQKLDTMLQFLDQRVRVLATGSKAQNHAKRESKGATCASSSTTRKDCLYCKKPNHVMFRCDDFRSKPVAERLNWVQRQKLCVNCFKADHMAKACQSKYKCFKCDKRHNTLLHLETNSMEPKNPVVASASSKNISLLATAKVVVQGNNGQQATFKALLDSGSQINVISERLASSLSLKRHDTSLRIEGIGADSAQEAIHIREELVKILRPNGFNLRKWCSNNDQLLHGIPKDDVASDVKFDDSLDSHRIKTLGLIWMPKKDQLCGRAQSSTALKITKRVVCSELAQIFDPLGLFAPVVVKAKIFMQRLWEDKLELHEHNLWLYGPLFLHGSPDKWTAPFIITPSNLERKTKHISLAISPSTIGEELYTCRHSNSFYKLQRIVAYMLRFCYKGYRATTTTVCTKELDRSRNLILRTIQQAEFPADLKMLQRYNTVDRKSSISSLSPVLGSDGLMRVGGRLEQAPLPYNAKHQILLPYNDPIVKMLLRELHEDNMHCAHFLIGETLTAPPDVNADRNEKSLLKRWELVSRLKQGFWKQWSEEYLQELQARHKWKTVNANIKEDMLVLIKEDNIPVMSWPMGRIVKTYPGQDNHVRVVDVKTASGIFKRPITRLAPLFPEEMAKKRPINEAEDTGTTDAPIAQRKRLMSPTISSSMLILLLMLPLVLAQSVSVTKFDTKPGIYYEKIGQTMRAISDWTMVIYYDLDPYWRDMKTFNSGISEFQYLCPEVNNKPTCDSISQHYRHLYDELQMANVLMQHTRKRRSPFDAVGNIANSLFGVLDSNYANEMTKVIKKVQTNEEFVLSLLKNQTSVLDSTINVVKKTRATSDKRLRLLEQQVAAIAESRGKYTGSRLTETYLALTTQLTLLAATLQRMQSEIVDVLTGIHHHTISPILVSPDQLKNQLDQIRVHLPPNQMLPVTSSNVIQLYRIMRAEGTATDTHVIFRVILPLVSTSILELFNIVPIPVWDSTSWKMFESKTPIIAVNNHRDQFMGLTHDDLRRCFALPNEEYICFDHQAVFNVNNRCEFQLFNNKTPTMCQTTHRTTKMVWEKTYQPNKWIFATRSTMELQAVCNGTPTTIQLEDTGVLSLSSGCTARNFEISISTFGNIISQTRQSYVRFGDIVKPNNTIAPAPKINIPNYTGQEDKDLDDLQLKLATLKNQELPNQVSSVQHHHIAAYAALVVSIILLCAYALRKQRLWTLRPTATRNETANPSAPSASPRRFTLDLEEG
ncbi:hypothetical protein ACLKA7_005595 [Drosophila subpalustris]